MPATRSRNLIPLHRAEMPDLDGVDVWRLPDELRDLSDYLDHASIYAGDDPSEVSAKRWGNYERHPIPRDRDLNEKVGEVTAFAAMHHERGEYWTDANYRHTATRARRLVESVRSLRGHVANLRGGANTLVRRHNPRAEKPFPVRVNRALHRAADKLRPRISQKLGRIARICDRYGLTCKIPNLSHVRQLYTLRGPSGDTVTV